MKKIRETLSRFGLWFGDTELAVRSSVMKSVHYDRSRRALKVTFNSGKTYEYGSLPPQVFRELMQADSKGRFFLRAIRPVYPYRVVTS